jgi:hypothetical protein
VEIKPKVQKEQKERNDDFPFLFFLVINIYCRKLAGKFAKHYFHIVNLTVIFLSPYYILRPLSAVPPENIPGFIYLLNLKTNSQWERHVISKK